MPEKEKKTTMKAERNCCCSWLLGRMIFFFLIRILSSNSTPEHVRMLATKDFAFKSSKIVSVSCLDQKRNTFLIVVSLLFLLLVQPNKRRRGVNRAFFLKMCPLCKSFPAVMAIIVILITIRANHWSFQGENYPSVTCLSPGKAPKCPYYHHQGH